MRTIKFRAWDKKEKTEKMIYLTQEFLKERQGNLQDFLYSPDRFIPMQFTGLKDKNGKEIYDKDLIKICFMGNPDAEVNKWRYKVEAIYQVNIGLFQTTMDMVKLIKPESIIDHIHLEAEDYWWDGEIFKIAPKYSSGKKSRSDGELEVIGNVYQNPDIIKLNKENL